MDKQAKITAAVDEPSFAKAIRLVRDLTSEVSKLVAATTRASAGLGATRVSGVAATAGTGSPATLQQAVQRAGAGGGGGLTDNLTRAVSNSATLFRTAAEGSKGAFRVMSDALRSHVTQSDQEISRLVHSLQRLETTYERLRSRQGSGLGGGLTEGAVQQARSRYYEGSNQLASARSQRQGLHEAMGSLDFEAGASGGGAVPDYEEYFVSSKKPPWYRRPIFTGVSRAVRGPLNAMGIQLPAGASMAGMVMGGLALMSRGAGMYNDNAMSNISYALDAPQFAGQRRAQLGSFYGGTALSVRHGDVARSMALGRLAQDMDYRKVVSSEYRGLLRTEAEKQNPSFTELPTIGNAKRLLGQQVGATIAEMKQSIFGSANSFGTDTQNDIAQQRARQAAAVRVTQVTQQMLESEMQRDPMFNDRVNSIYGGATGSLSMARAAGISGGLRSRRNGMGELEHVDTLQMLRSRALGAGYDPGEWVGMIQAAQGAAGRGSMSAATGRLLSMTHGGLGNATELFGVGSQFGGGRAAGGGAFLSAIQGKTGTGGIDPVAAAQIFGVGAGMMTGGSFADSSGMGIVGTLGDAGYTGAPGTDLMRARQLGSGVGAMGQVLGGRVDPLQQALNASAALRAAPGGNYAAHKGLMDMDPGTMMEVLRTGRVPGWLAARGVTVDQVRAYSSTQNSTALSRYSSTMGSGTEMGAAAGRYTRSGGLSYLRGSSRSQVEAEVNRLAEVLVDTTGASRDSARGRLLLQASMGGLLPSARGRGAHQSASMGSAYGVSSQIQGYNEEVEAVKRGAQNDLIKSGVVASPDTVADAERMRVAGQNHAGLGGDTDVAIEGVDSALRAFVASLRRVQGSFSKPGPLHAGPQRGSAHR